MESERFDPQILERWDQRLGDHHVGEPRRETTLPIRWLTDRLRLFGPFFFFFSEPVEHLH